MKNFYVALQVEESGKYYAYVLKVSESENLIPALNINNVQFANICETKKKAETVVNMWNTASKLNGNYLFDTPSF